MFEEDIELLKEYKQYLTDALLPEFSESEDFDDIEFRSKLGDIEDDLKNIEYSMPYDEIEEDDIPIEDMSGENLEDGELEDEIVELKSLIEDLYKMLEEVRLQYFDDEGEILIEYAHIRPKFKYTEEYFLEDLFSWLNEEIINKTSRKGPYLNADAINRLKMCIYFDAKCRSDHKVAAELAAKECPELKLTEEEIRINHLFSGGIFHITFEMIKAFDSQGYALDFRGTLNFHRDIWKDLI